MARVYPSTARNKRQQVSNGKIVSAIDKPDISHLFQVEPLTLKVLLQGVVGTFELILDIEEAGLFRSPGESIYIVGTFPP